MRTPATSLPLDVELLEDRTLQDAKPSFVIPTALLGDSLVQQWNQEHVLLETGTQRVSALQGDVGRLTIELTTDRAQAALAGDGLTKTAPTLTAAIADRDRLQLELKNLNTSLQSLTTLRTTHQQLVTKLTQEIQTLTATLETQKRELQQLQAAPVVTTTLATLQQQKTAAEQDRTRLQAEHRAIAADTTLTPTIKNQRLEAKNNEIIAKSKVIEALITKINQPQTQSVVPVTSPASQKTIDAKKLAITGTQAAIDKKKIDLGAAKKVVDADTVQIGTVTATVKTKESQVSAANTVVATQTAQRDSYAQAMAAAIAEQNKDELAMTAAKTDLVAANLFVQNETAKTGVLDAAMADFLTHYQATMLVPKEKIETTLLPLEIVLKSEGSNTWSLEAKNLRDGDSVYLWRRVYKWDGQRNNIVWGAFAGVAAEGTEYFTAIGDWPHSSPDTTAEMRVTDAKGTVLATKTVDFMNKAGASFTINEVQKQVTTIVKTGAASALAQQKETLTGPPTVTSTLSNGKVHLRMQGLPARTTAILRGPNIDYRDIVMPMGDGEITPAFLSPELFVLGKYTIQFTRDGQLLDTPKTLGPGSTLSVEGMQRSDTLSDSAETITAAPRMQIVATREGVTFRYQFLPAGSNLEIAETDHGSLIPNPSRSEVPLQGTQGSISLKGQFPDCWYRFLVTGPDGKLTGLEWNIYIPGGNTGLVISNPVISKTQSTTVPLSSTAPMPWIGELDHQTFSGGASYNWAGQMNDQARAITGLDIPGDQIVGAFQTIVKERMGFIPLSLLPAVPQALRTVIERPDIFAQLYDAHTQMSATQAADRNGIATNETALWKKHDEVQLKNST
ncbi:MAG: hypothetical protein HOO67_04040, partial [Candidatus Peribacteraceae bacterium]|nr:hypothetical protein [Candidatus Peribacteraceae bacterium]